MRLRLAITMGDPAGIGPEVVVKALTRARRPASARFLLVGVPEVFAEAAAALDFPVRLRLCRSPEELKQIRQGEWPIWPVEGSPALRELCPGRPLAPHVRAACGEASYRAVCQAVELVQNGVVQGVVTAPIAKQHWELAGHHVPGHTELLAQLAGKVPVRMMLEGRRLRVVLLTTHLPLREVSRHLSAELVEETIRLVDRALRTQFALPSPRLAVAALNPHAGEGGLFGHEDDELLRPAVERARQSGLNVVGPLPADTVYYHAASGAYDAVLAPYHDQALAPFKLLHFRDGVNVTIGLPFVRTSPDHGTAFDIAGRGKADPTSMAAAISLAAHLARQAQKQRAD